MATPEQGFEDPRLWFTHEVRGKAILRVWGIPESYEDLILDDEVIEKSARMDAVIRLKVFADYGGGLALENAVPGALDALRAAQPEELQLADCTGVEAFLAKRHPIGSGSPVTIIYSNSPTDYSTAS